MSRALLLLLAAFICLAVAAETFDYVIVGGGTCGLVLANRLTELPHITVAVIEPGGDTRNNPNVTDVNKFLVAYNTSVDWQYLSTPQQYAGNRVFQYHQGKALGGSSAINGMTYIRGQKAQFDAWERLGNPNWNWDALLPYYKKAEHFDPPQPEQRPLGASYRPQYHGTSGDVHVGYPLTLQNGTFYKDVAQSWQAVGQPHNPDANSGDVSGFEAWPYTCKADIGRRADAAWAYLYPIEHRPNLKIFRGTATNVVISDKDSEATGVKFTAANGTSGTLNAKREVILSAGAIRTPALLELSGIGNPKILSKYGIKTKIDLKAVGENLVDQPNVALAYKAKENITGLTPYATFSTAAEYFGKDSVSIAANVRNKLSSWAQRVSDASDGAVSAQAIEQIYRIQHDLIFRDNVPSSEVLTIGQGPLVASAYIPLLPFSRGSVHIGSSNGLFPPRIDPKFLLIDYDLDVSIAIGKQAQHFWATSPVKNNWVDGPLQVPETTGGHNATDAQWRDFLAKYLNTNTHPLGTAAMMRRELGGVVDSHLKVYGAKNLRVVDASILPMQISGHLSATLYAVAERAAEFIKGDLRDEEHEV